MQLQQEKQFAKYNLLRKCGLLAHTSAAFLKNCCTEKLFSCLRLVTENNSLRKTSTIRFGKAGAHPQLAWESQLPLKPCILIAASRLKRQLRFFRFPSRFLLQFYLKVRFAPQMWATRPHLASIFEKLLEQKTFYLPAARILQPLLNNAPY